MRLSIAECGCILRNVGGADMIIPFVKVNRQARICNYCGKEIDDFSGSLSIKDVRMPYLSRFDMDALNLTLCPDCLDRIVDDCRISPITEYGT